MGDYFESSTSIWLDEAEQDAARQKDEARRGKNSLNGRKKQVRISFDFAGRRVVLESSDEEDEDGPPTPSPLDLVAGGLSLADKSSAPETLVGVEDATNSIAPWRAA